MRKTDQQCELEAGIILGNLQSNGFGPQDVVVVLIHLSAYMIERNRRPGTTQKQALNHWCEMLREYVSGSGGTS